MSEKKEKLVVEGNAFYELDMECMKRRQKTPSGQNGPKDGEKRTSRYKQSKK